MLGEFVWWRVVSAVYVVATHWHKKFGGGGGGGREGNWGLGVGDEPEGVLICCETLTQSITDYTLSLLKCN